MTDRDVVWVRCDDCKRDWPFPGPYTAKRDWQCDQCHRAECMRMVREARHETDILRHAVDEYRKRLADADRRIGFLEARISGGREGADG